MGATQVVLYFDRQEDALLFTLAASSAIAADEPVRANEAMEKIAKEICKASRITTEGVLNPASSAASNAASAKCA
jgi:leucyl aminopeptidase (aminopeptidase T)